MKRFAQYEGWRIEASPIILVNYRLGAHKPPRSDPERPST
jgi:hypothetical protein